MVFISEKHKWLNYCLLFSVSPNHSIASSKQVPLVTEVLNICYFPSVAQVNLPSLRESCPVPLSCLFVNPLKWLLSALLPPNWQLTLILKYHFGLGHHNLLHKWLHASLNNNISCLPSQILDLEFKVFVYYHLNIKSNGRNSSNDFSNL